MTIKVHNSSTSECLFNVEPAKPSVIENVFQRTREVQLRIVAMSLDERIPEMVKISDYVITHQESIIDRLLQETGKSRFDALNTDIFEICNGIDYYRGEASKIFKDQKVHTPLVLMGKKSKVVYEPLDVVLVIAPWNYSLIQCFTPSLLAFLAGNAVIFKPSENTPLQGLYEKIMTRAGFIPDAIRVVYSVRETGAELIEARPDKTHFTGSVRGGKQVMATAAQYLIPVDLELGRKDAAIVFNDVDIEGTDKGVVWATFTNAGQSCTSIERCYVQEGIYDIFEEKVIDLTKKLRSSTPTRDLADSTAYDVGCMTVDFQLKTIEEQLQEAVDKGGHVLCGGKRITGSLYFPPTVVVDVTHEMQLGFDETFGPVLPIMKFKTEAEAIQLANDSPYGLSASVVEGHGTS